ncbi:polymorphic toxin-type HINT domain-containing protein [Isoptericola sediminis]
MLVLPPLLDGAYVPHNSSSPLAGRGVARDRTGFTGTPPFKLPPVARPSDNDSDDNFVKEFAEGAADYGAEVVDGMVELAKAEWHYLNECMSSNWLRGCAAFADFNKMLIQGDPLMLVNGLIDEFKSLQELFNSGRTAYALGRLSAIVLEALALKGAAKAALVTVKALKLTGCKPGNSFAPGTLILLADGTLKAIEDIDLGDEVLAADEETGEKTEGREVTRLIIGEGDRTLVTITVQDRDGQSQEIVATDGHPFWVPDLREWVDAVDLDAGSWLQTAAGTWIQVTAIDVQRERAVVHNLTVDVDHTYYVQAGSVPLLVHNCGSANGGKYGDLKPSGAGKEVNHIPAKAASPLTPYSGPAIRMDYADHRAVYSTGPSLASQAWRTRQKELIDSGDFRGAMQMDVDDIRARFGSKYDDAIAEMWSSLSSNKALQAWEANQKS